MSGSTRASIIGRSIPRREDARFITGSGSYTDDRRVEGELHAVFLRAPVAHGKLKRLDIAAALRMPGVACILTGEDYAGDGLQPVDHLPNPADPYDIRKRALIHANGRDVEGRPHWPLVRGVVHHLGEPIAMIVAESAVEAQDAAETIELDIEELPAVISATDAAAACEGQTGHSLLFFDLHSGDAETSSSAFAGAAHIVSHTFNTNRVVNCQMEPRAAIGLHENGAYTLISGNQGVSRLQMQLAQCFAVDIEKVRIITPDTGGGFGPRTYLYPEQICVLWAARKTGRPVRSVSTRHEAFLSDYQGRDSLAHVSLALDAEGHFLAYKVDFISNIGAHSVAYVTAANALKILPTLYRIPVMDVRLRGVRTHTVPTAPWRGAGRPEGNHLMERLIDIAAAQTGIDRIELRRRNLVRPRDLPYTSAAGLVYHSTDFPAYMKQALKLADWTGFERRRKKSARAGKLRGIGLANHIEAPVGAPVERLKINILDGKIELVVGTQSTGQGHETTYAQIASDLLGVDVADVIVTMGDTAVVSMGGGTHSDRSLRYVSTLAKRVADKMIAAGIGAAAAAMQTEPADVTFADGLYRSQKLGSEIAFLAAARHAKAAGMALAETFSEDLIGRLSVFPGGCAVCEIEIEPDTGETRVVNYLAVDDVGQIVNPAIVEGQAHGGIVQGLGQAAREGVAFADGQMLTATFMDYALIRADDVPFFTVDHIEAPATNNPYRIKGGGEGGNTPVTAAYINAICDALGETARDFDMPVTAQAVWNKLRAKQAK